MSVPSTLQEALVILRNPNTTKEDRALAVDVIVDLLAKEKEEQPEKYEESLTILYDLLQEVRLALEK